MMVHQPGGAIQAELGTEPASGKLGWLCYSGMAIIETIARSRHLTSVIIIKIKDRDAGLF